MKRLELLGEVRDTLIKAGFYVSELYLMRPIGFDLVARRDNSLLIIKVLINIDAMAEEVASELRKLSTLLKGCPLIIGQKSGAGDLQDDAIYDRFGIQTITLETLKTNLLEGIPIEVYAAPGGLYVNLDNEKIKRLRVEQNISLGSFARSLKVSRRTVQMYEDGMNATIEVTIRIEDALGTNVALPINLFRNIEYKKEVKLKSSELDVFRKFQREVFSILEKVGYTVTPLERCVFEAVSQDKKKVLLTCVDEYNKNLLKKAQAVSSISKVTEKHAVLITDKDVNKTSLEGTPLIVRRELKKIRGPEEIIDLILERLYRKN
ncbi:MAG: transcriptional regulator [Thermoplasmatales archaeon SG8-52-3]|nr:MAG: transcriptional regulator [Thermoplasmatales archaeon SG8-52-3]